MRFDRRQEQAACLRHVWLAALLSAFIVGGALTSSGALAQTGLMVFPTRVVFDGRTRSAQLTIVNNGTSTTTYRISFKNMRMTEEGGFEEIQEPGPGDRFADKLIRYSPRQVVLEPGKPQTVRLLLRRPKDLAPGEYRSHLQFLTVPPETAGADIETLDIGEGEMRIAITMIFGITIPVIVRHGDLSATVTLSDLALEAPDDPDGPLMLSLRLNRSGDRSVFGDVTVVYTPVGGGEIEVALSRGLATYVPNPSRTVTLLLRLPDGVSLSGGTLRVSFGETGVEGGGTVAEAELDVP